MDRMKVIGAAARKAVRTLCIAAVASTAAALLVATASLFATPAEEVREVGRADPAGWGSEALALVAEHAFEAAPIAVANACGIGASSCFKCHNGTRAPAAKADKASSPWHPQHKTVNDSCVGCHAGNARIIKKEIAHTGLVKDPRTAAANCDRCHKSGNTADLVKSYQMASRGGK